MTRRQSAFAEVTRAVSGIPPKWMGEQTDDSLSILSLSLAEIWRGILEKPTGKKRRELEAWFSGAEGPQALFRGRVLPFGENAALIWGDLMAAGATAGRPRSALDMVIAAIAQSNNCVLVTDNERHFQERRKKFIQKGDAELFPPELV